MADSMHRHNASSAKSPMPVKREPMKDRLNVVVRRFAKGLVRQINGLIKKRVCNEFIHVAIFGQGRGAGYSYFPIDFVHVATLGQGSTNKNVRGMQA